MDKLCYKPSTLRMINYIREHKLEDRVILRGITAADYIGLINLDYLDKGNKTSYTYFTKNTNSDTLGPNADVFIKKVNNQDDYLYTMFGNTRTSLTWVGCFNALKHKFETTIITDRVQFIMRAIWLSENDIAQVGIEKIDGILTEDELDVYKDLLTENRIGYARQNPALIESLAVYYARHNESFNKLKYVLNTEQLKVLEIVKPDVLAFYRNIIA